MSSPTDFSVFPVPPSRNNKDNLTSTWDSEEMELKWPGMLPMFLRNLWQSPGFKKKNPQNINGLRDFQVSTAAHPHLGS